MQLPFPSEREGHKGERKIEDAGTFRIFGCAQVAAKVQRSVIVCIYEVIPSFIIFISKNMNLLSIPWDLISKGRLIEREIRD